MGRVKLKIKRLESSSNRQITYSKRRNGILKKAKELSILCDVDILLLMFSPTEKPTIFHGKHSLEEIITKFAQLSPQERAKRKLESLEGLRKTFKKLDHDVNIQDFLGASNPTVEELGNHVRLLQCHLTEVHRRLRCWCDMDVTMDLELITQMEDTLRESLNQIHLCKENYRQHQHTSLEYRSEHALQYPSMFFGMQEAQPLSWHPYPENQHMQNFLLSEDPNFLSQREVECGSNVSFPSHSGYCMGTTSEQAEIDTRGQINNVVYEEPVPQEYTNSVFLNEQYPYHPYTSHSAVTMFSDNSFPQRPN